MTHRRDEPDGPLCVRQTVARGHAVVRNGLQLRTAVQDRLRGEVCTEILSAAHRHALDEAHLPVVRARQRGKIGDLVVVDAAEQHAVELDLRKARALRRLDTVQGILQRTKARDGAKALLVQRVEADVEVRDARVAQRPGNLLEQAAIRRDAELFNAGNF